MSDLRARYAAAAQSAIEALCAVPNWSESLIVDAFADLAREHEEAAVYAKSLRLALEREVFKPHSDVNLCESCGHLIRRPNRRCLDCGDRERIAALERENAELAAWLETLASDLQRPLSTRDTWKDAESARDLLRRREEGR